MSLYMSPVCPCVLGERPAFGAGLSPRRCNIIEPFKEVTRKYYSLLTMFTGV